jgi:hypothetical protein
MRGGEVLCNAKLLRTERIFVPAANFLFMYPSKAIPMNRLVHSVKLWYSTNLLHGIWWASSFLILQGKFSFDVLIVALLIIVFSALASALVIPCAIPLFTYALALSKSARIATVGIIIPVLWGLSTVPLMLIPTYVSPTISSFLSNTLPALGAAYLAAAYTYRVWLFRC